jgi:hypothetical protein
MWGRTAEDSAKGNHRRGRGRRVGSRRQAAAAFAFTIVGGKVAEIEIFADPEALRRLDVRID